jgi:tetratricopeptide (TPR) repeat protein
MKTILILLSAVAITNLITTSIYSQKPTPSGPTPTTYEGWYAAGTQQYRNRDFNAAVNSFTECIKLNSAPPASVYFVRGNAYNALANAEKALTDYSKAIELQPANDTFQIIRGNLYSKQKKYVEAINDYSLAIQNNTKIPEAWLNRGRMQTEIGKYDLAITDFNFLIGKNATQWQPFAGRAVAYCRQGNAEKAIDDEVMAYQLGGNMELPCSKWTKKNGLGSDIFPFKNKNQKWGYVNTTGKIIVEPQYDQAYDFSEGYAQVSRLINNKYTWGYINTAGKEVIPCKYAKSYEFSEGLGMVSTKDYPDDKYGFINYKGEMVIAEQYGYNPQYLYANKFSEGLVAVGSGYKYGMINRKGEVFLPFNYNSISSFSEGIATVSDGDNKYLLNHKKEMKLSIYKYVGEFSEGLAPVCTNYVSSGMHLNGKDGFIDRTGKTIINPAYEVAAPFSEGLAAVEAETADTPKKYRWGFIDRSAKMVIPPQYDFFTDFSEGLAFVRKPEPPPGFGGTVFFIDRTGKIVIDLPNAKFSHNTFFRNGFAMVENKDGSFVLIDKTGKAIKEFK